MYRKKSRRIRRMGSFVPKHRIQNNNHDYDPKLQRKFNKIVQSVCIHDINIKLYLHVNFNQKNVDETSIIFLILNHDFSSFWNQKSIYFE